MGIAYRCETRIGLAVAVWEGEITDDQRRLHMAKLAADPDWDATRLLITDLTGVSPQSRPTADKIAEAGDTFLQQLANRAANVKWAIIADHTFEDARKFGAHIEGEVPHMIVFNRLDTACVWLGIDSNDVRPVIEELRQQLRAESQ